MNFQTTYLSLAWSTSKARDSYGYNRAKLTDQNTGKSFVTCGGGYDMTGTVFADWLEATFQSELLQFAEFAGSTWNGIAHTHSDNPGYYSYGGTLLVNSKLYGMTFYSHKKEIKLDGRCGLNSIMQIAHVLGLEVKRTHNKKGHTTGFIVSKKEA